MPKKFTLYIDESGDQGLDRVMTHESPFGASSYLTMGAVLIPTAESEKNRRDLANIRTTLSASQLHCTDMSHAQVSYFAQEVSKLRMLCFGVVSKKATLGDYKKEITGETQAQDYYNKCSQYLFEMVGSYAGLKEIPAEEIDIVFEKKRGHDYSRLGRFLKAISKKPIDARAAKLAYLSPFSIRALAKSDEELLALADVVAYSLHKAFCSENNRLKLTEQRYLRQLRSKFHSCSETGVIANHGVKFIKGPMTMGLKGDDLKFAMKFYKSNSKPA